MVKRVISFQLMVKRVIIRVMKTPTWADKFTHPLPDGRGTDRKPGCLKLCRLYAERQRSIQVCILIVTFS